MRKTKMEKGITLIALIITIIVLLILAVVSIGTIKDSKIIDHAQTAKDDWEKAQNNELASLNEYEELIEKKLAGKTDASKIGKATVGTVVSKNSTINGEAYSSDNPVIPKGFKAINVTTEGHESYWDAEGGPQVSEGLVISDGNSEFVWIPVRTPISAYGLNTIEYREPDVVTGVNPSDTVDSASGMEKDAIPENLSLAGCKKDLNGDGNIDVYDFKKQLEDEFSAMANSVNTYKGFYVGRYEVSYNSKTQKAESVKGIKSANASDSTSNTWYGLYALCETYELSSVKSSMIWGCQYDAIMTFIGEAANVTIEKRNTTQTTGNVEEDEVNNIYDLYGCCSEWTLEAYADTRVYRGGYARFGYTPQKRLTWFPSVNEESGGSRLALYVIEE